MTPAVNITKLHTHIAWVFTQVLRIKNKISLHIIPSFVFITVVVFYCEVKTTFL